jgi:hypothetical protein
MATNQGRDREITRREAEMYRVEQIQDEMAIAVRFLGGEGPAKQSINNAARAARLPHTVIERLRWKKIKRVPADLADTIREAVERHNEKGLGRARHEAFIARQQAPSLLRALRKSILIFTGMRLIALGSRAATLGTELIERAERDQ